MVLAPGAFFLIGIFIWVLRWRRPALVTADQTESIMEELLSLFVKAVFVENMALALPRHVLVPCRLEEG